MRRHLLWPASGVALVVAARLVSPSAPPLYDGIITAPEPYHYCNPPANLASNNKPPAAGAKDLPALGDSNQLGSPATSDNQVLTFFPKGALKAAGAQSFHVEIKPNCSPPAAPAKKQPVGNAYDLLVTGQPGDLAVTFIQPAQVLLRTPPVQYTSVELYYDGAWHKTQWGQQGDTANVTVDHAGILATFDDGSRNPAGKPAGQQSPGIVTIIEIVLVSAALGIVVAAIIVQQRRARALGAAAATGTTKKPRSKR